MRMNALGANVAFSVCAPNADGRWKPTTNVPPAAIPACRNPRLVSAASSGAFRDEDSAAGSMFDRRADANVRAAPANISRHGRIDVGIVRMRGGVEQSRRRHDLAGLAVAALDHLHVEPRLLYFGAHR